MLTKGFSVDIDPDVGGTVEVGGSIPLSYPYSRRVQQNADVLLNAMPAPGYQFAYWSGDLTGDENPTRLKADDDKTVVAHFVSSSSGFTSEDEILSIVIPEGATMLDGESNPITSLEFIVIEPPPPPQGASIVGPSYDLGPHGTTFDQPVTLTWSYDSVDIPPGVAEGDLTLAYYDEDASEWKMLLSEVDPINNIITTLAEHFTIFAIIAPAISSISSLDILPSEVSIGESVNISVLVTNTGEEESGYTVTLKINGAIEQTKEITLAAGSSATIAFSVTKGEVGTYSVDVNGLTDSFLVTEALLPLPPPTSPSLSGVNWAILGPIIPVALVLTIILPIKLLRKRKKRFDSSTQI